MKIQNTLSFRHAHAAVLAAVAFALATPAHGQSWDGGSTTANSWGTAANWNPDVVPTFGTTTDIIFNDLTRPDNDLGAARIVRSISYGANMDSAFQTNFRTFTPSGAAAALTLQAASGNATITVDSDATGNLSLGWSGVGTAGGALILGSNLDIIHNGTGVLNFNRQITGTGFGFTKSGTGTMQFGTGNANTLTGAVTVNAGRLIAASTAATTGDLNTVSGVTLGGGTLEIRTTSALNKVINPNLTVSSASTFAYNNTAATDQSLTIGTGSMALNANLTLQNISTSVAGNNLVNITRNLTGSGNLIVDTYNNVTAIANSFSPGRVQLSGDNSAWSGNLVVAKGTAQLSGVNTPGTGSSITLGTTGDAFGAGLAFNQSANVSIAQNITVTTGGFRGIKNVGGGAINVALNGNITLDGNLSIDHTLSTGQSFTLAGNITGAGNLNISGNATNLVLTSLNLTGNNTYSGATNIASGGSVVVNSASGNGIGNSSAVTLAGTGTLTTTTAETIGSLASSGTDGVLVLTSSLTTGGNNASTSYGGTSSGAGGLTKTGSGAMTLTGANAYTGKTLVGAGSLIIGAGSTLASTNIEVASAATLDITAGGLTIASGNRIGGDGTISGNLTLASGAQFVFSLGTTLDVTGTVSLDNTFSIASLINSDGSEIDWTSISNGTYTLIGTTSSSFSNISNFGLANAAPLAGGKSAYFQNGSLNLVVIPEPSSWALLVAGLTTVMVFRRRRSHS